MFPRWQNRPVTGEVPGRWAGAARLAAALVDQGVTNVAAGRELHVSDATISRYASGERAPDPDTLAHLCRFLKVSADHLLGLSSAPGAVAEARPQYGASGPGTAAGASNLHSSSEGDKDMATETAVRELTTVMTDVVLARIVQELQSLHAEVEALRVGNQTSLSKLETLQAHMLKLKALEQPAHSDEAPKPRKRVAKATRTQEDHAHRREAR